MLGNDFYHGLVQKYVVLFGTLFNDLTISRFDADKKAVQTMKVALGYGPREHWLARIDSDPNLDRAYAEFLPRMAYEITGIHYDTKRKLVTTQKYATTTLINGEKRADSSVFMPVPYDIHFRLSILTKSAEDGLKIVEQILPYFTPDWTVTANLLDEFPNYKIDVPLEITGINYDDQYDAAYEKRRTITWTIDFKMGAYLFGPTSKAKVIKIAKVNFIGNQNNFADETIIVRPGLTANGEPTSDPAQSVPITQIEETDNYGYIVTIENNSV